MRVLTDHIVSGDQAVQLEIDVLDEPGAGGANHVYSIRGYWPHAGLTVPLDRLRDVEVHPGGDVSGTLADIFFQNGPIKEAGLNGLTQEALVAIVIDRLRSFQAGPFSCRENAIALTHFEEGLMWLQQRTVARIKRGVEGTNQK